jgi:acyl dehydratase
MRETKRADRGIVNFYVALVNQRGETVQDGKWKLMMHRKPADANQ